MSIIKTRKYDYIDALRGIAIILVIMVHTSQKVKPGNGILANIMGHGDKGVQLFFIVSALTLCFSLQSRKGKESRYILYFFLRRFFRVAPLFYLAILFYQYPFNFTGGYYAPNGMKGWYILSAVTFMHGWHPETFNSVVPGSWSIAVEFTFYLTLPFLFKLINNKGKSVLFLIFTLVINYFIRGWIYQYWAGIYPKDQLYLVWDVSYYNFFNQLPVFATGIALFHFFKGHTFKDQKLISILYIVLAVFLMIVADTWVYQKYTGKIVIYAVAFAFVIYGLANNSFSLIVNPLTKLTGKVSYSMYFIHFAVLDYFVRFGFFGLSEFKTYGTLIALAIVFMVTMLVALATYNLVEKKGIALGGYLIQKIENKTVGKNT